jgi:predicted RNase H-like nuclease (RuvC/YqgF family)
MDIEKEIDKMYEELDQKQAEMEELGLINYGDSGYYWRNPEEYEKDLKIANLESEVERLEHNLAEKEKEIEKLKTLLDAIDKYGQYDKDVENLVLLNPENCYSNGHKVVIKTNNQDKISFAVEQLERAKEIIDIYVNNLDDGIDCMWAIDQLITEIKEGK